MFLFTSATLLKPAAHTNKVPTCMVCGEDNPDRQMAFHTLVSNKPSGVFYAPTFSFIVFLSLLFVV